MTAVEGVYNTGLRVLDTEDFLLHNGTIGLRPFRRKDAEPLHEAICESFEELRSTMTWCRNGYSYQDSQTFVAKNAEDWRNGYQYNFVIVDLEVRKFIGSIGLSRVDRQHNYANVGYWVRSKRTRRGVASASARLVTQFALTELDFDRLEFLVARSNVPSQRVAQKVGAKLEGVLRRRLNLDGRLDDAFLFSLVKDDLFPPIGPIEDDGVPANDSRLPDENNPPKDAA